MKIPDYLLPGFYHLDLPPTRWHFSSINLIIQLRQKKSQRMEAQMNLKETEIILWRGAAVGMGLLFFSFFMNWGFSDFVISMHAYFFKHSSPAQIASDLYLIFGVFKILIFVLFVIPALAIRWHRRRQT